MTKPDTHRIVLDFRFETSDPAKVEEIARIAADAVNTLYLIPECISLRHGYQKNEEPPRRVVATSTDIPF